MDGSISNLRTVENTKTITDSDLGTGVSGCSSGTRGQTSYYQGSPAGVLLSSNSPLPTMWITSTHIKRPKGALMHLSKDDDQHEMKDKSKCDPDIHDVTGSKLKLGSFLLAAVWLNTSLMSYLLGSFVSKKSCLSLSFMLGMKL